ncbi:22925_t:CDS:2 [Entrophospora sp. SA101]|nr:4402_t:CDS:2 [Entrophospora sp. SA101]CAJ0750019.1 22925_t:CDS:2 [Entrophospora sp. SA101]
MKTNTKTLSIKGEELKEAPFPVFQNKLGYDESDKMNSAHFMLKLVWDNFGSPVTEVLKNGGKVLDICCGTGIWTLEMSVDFPKSRFYGIDINHLFPECVKPPNSEFIQSNIQDGLPFEEEVFDFVFIRDTMLSLESKEWENVVLNEAIRVTKPGGYIEIVEPHLVAYDFGENFTNWFDTLLDMLLASKLDLSLNLNLDKILDSHDRLDNNLEQVTIYYPIGKWGKVTGEFGKEATLCYIEYLKDRICDYTKMSKEDYERIVNECKKEFDDENIKGYFN